jgi:hypothetical protein
MFQMIKQAYSREAVVLYKCSAHGRDSLEDDEHIGRPRMVRPELKIQEVAMLVQTTAPKW